MYFQPVCLFGCFQYPFVKLSGCFQRRGTKFLLKVQLNFHTFDLGEFCEGYVIGGSVYFTEIFVEMMMIFLQQIACF